MILERHILAGSGTQTVSGPGNDLVASVELAVPNQADLPAGLQVVVEIGARKVLTGGGASAVGDELRWKVGVAEAVLPGLTFPTGPTPQTFRTALLPNQPNGQPWTPAAANALVIVARSLFDLVGGSDQGQVIASGAVEVYEPTAAHLTGSVGATADDIYGPKSVAQGMGGAGDGVLEPIAVSGAIGASASGVEEV